MKFFPGGIEEEMKKRDLLSLTDLSRGELDRLLKRSIELKRKWKRGLSYQPLAGMCLGLIFDKP
jgi:ornithine carbamoyltransferase